MLTLSYSPLEQEKTPAREEIEAMNYASPNPLHSTVPKHILDLLDRLHEQSRTQESAISAQDLQSRDFDELMRDKFIALDQDKSQFLYQICRTINAKTIVEAGTSYGVSTIYLALAASKNASATGGKGRVIATENEPAKAQKAREHWDQCGEIVSGVVDLREGDLRETLKEDVEGVDLLLLDSEFNIDSHAELNMLYADGAVWTPMALPTLKLIQPKMRHGAVVLADNTAKNPTSYKELLEYLRAPESRFSNLTLPYTNGLEMSVYLPRQ